LSHPEGYTWKKCYLDEYDKETKFLHGEKPDEFVVWLSKYLKEKDMSDAIILDAGCGEGRNSVYLGKQGFKTYGIDIASPAIEKAKNWVKSEGLTDKVDLKVGDITNLPYDDESFDAVYDGHTMEFIPEKERYIEEVARVLKQHGLFFLFESIPPASPHNVDPKYLVKILKRNFEIWKLTIHSASLAVVATKRLVT